MRWSRWGHALALGLFTTLTSCGSLYQHIVVPVDVNLTETPVYAGEGDSETQHISFNANVDWGDGSVAEAVKRGGLNTVYYADREIFSVLGIYREETLHVYGK